jgi:hypothetical protein
VQNVANSAVTLASNDGRPWKLRGGVDFDFGSSYLLAPGGQLVVVAFDPQKRPDKLSAFRQHYRANPNATIVGPYSGRLNNVGDVVQLRKPGELVTDNGVQKAPELILESVNYRNTSPWPQPQPGASLLRKMPALYGNDPQSWLTGIPSPGGEPSTDSDNDGLPDNWERDNFGGLTTSDGTQDFDADGFTDGDEFVAGTNPKNALSALKLVVWKENSKIYVRFQAAEGKGYKVLRRDTLNPGVVAWDVSQTIPVGAARQVEWEETVPASGQRFLKLLIQ